MALAGMNFLIIPQYVICAHLDHLNGTFERVIKKVKICPTSGSLAALRNFLATFRAEHTAILSNVTHLNDSIGSKWLLGALIAEFPVNLWMITHLMYRKLAPGETVLIVCLIFLQLYLALTARSIMIKITVALHSSAKHLGHAQTVLNVFQPETKVISCALNYGATVRAKLKLAVYYEMVHTEDKFCFTLGPLGKLSQRGILDVSIAFLI